MFPLHCVQVLLRVQQSNLKPPIITSLASVYKQSIRVRDLQSLAAMTCKT